MEQTTNLPIFEIGDHLYNSRYNLVGTVRYVNTTFFDEDEKFRRMYDVESDDDDYWTPDDCVKITEQELLVYRLKLGDANKCHY